MNVIFFAQSRQATGCSSYVLSVEKSLRPSEFWALLIEKFPALASLQHATRLARQETYLANDDLIHAHDEIAVLPPVSGG